MDIDSLREKIDKIDEEIVCLLNKRYENVLQIGKLKNASSKGIYVPEREKSLINRLLKINKGPMTENALKSIYREIMSGAIALEHPIKIGFPSDNLSFAKYAGIKKFGVNIKNIEFSSISEVFKSIQNGKINYGIVPVENSQTGVIYETFDAVLEYDSIICAEEYVTSHFSLMANSDNVDSLSSIYLTASVFSICSEWIKSNLKEDKIVLVKDINEVFPFLKNSDSIGIISDTFVGNAHNLITLAENIENSENIVTRFLILGKQKTKPTGDDKTSILLLIEDRAGALSDVFYCFKKNDVPVTFLETRPSKIGNWKYYFFIDFIGHADDDKCALLINELKNICTSFRVIGSYPKASFNSH